MEYNAPLAPLKRHLRHRVAHQFNDDILCLVNSGGKVNGALFVDETGGGVNRVDKEGDLAVLCAVEVVGGKSELTGRGQDGVEAVADFEVVVENLDEFFLNWSRKSASTKGADDVFGGHKRAHEGELALGRRA